MVVYIIKGYVGGKDNSYSVIGEYSVRNNLESAKQELETIINEIVDNAEKNGLEVVCLDRSKDKVIIELDSEDYYEYEIVERTVLD